VSPTSGTKTEKTAPAKAPVGAKPEAPKVAAKAAPAKVATKAAPAKEPVAKATTAKAPAKAPAKAAPAKATKAKAPEPKAAGPYAGDAKFLEEQRELLQVERAQFASHASELKAEADSLAQEREPGDVQFDEESGEGGTITVDRERDLALSAQALLAVEEIDAALARVADGTYGACERCHQPIPKPRLKALPFARLCVACKSGGLSRR
jgi:DnaK suppressor protein